MVDPIDNDTPSSLASLIRWQQRQKRLILQVWEGCAWVDVPVVGSDDAVEAVTNDVDAA